ncbi:hypothetical protein PI124_g9425 [Phytophthora idaei]|nr:hypothetical protein PI124_g9425 [Phytophthora idaei]
MPAWGPSPFEPLQLSVENAAKLGEIARVFVQDSMRSYKKYLDEDQRRLDDRRWKLTKQRDGVQVYVEQPLKERRKVGGASQDELEREYRRQLQCTAAGEKVTAAAAASLEDLPLLLAHKLTFMKPQGGLLRRDLRFCGRCVDRARAADTMAIASEELASRDEFSEFYQSLSPRFNGSSGRSIGI